MLSNILRGRVKKKRRDVYFVSAGKSLQRHSSTERGIRINSPFSTLCGCDV